MNINWVEFWTKLKYLDLFDRRYFDIIQFHYFSIIYTNIYIKIKINLNFAFFHLIELLYHRLKFTKSNAGQDLETSILRFNKT